jgi:hypothetical protein
MKKLTAIKVLHTMIWVFYNLVIFYLLYAVLVNRINKWVWISIGLVILEGIVLLVFRMKCPLTVVARKYSDSTDDNFDIYLPKWLAKYNKLIYTSIFVFAIIVLVYQLAFNQ